LHVKYQGKTPLNNRHLNYEGQECKTGDVKGRLGRVKEDEYG
jgi:hypothetical protein